METLDFELSILPPCDKCGHLTGIRLLPEILDKDAPTELVRSNYVPCPPDRSVILDSLSSNKTSIRILEAEIFDLYTAAALLQSRLSNIVRYGEFQLSLLSPVRKLPGELLSEIFSYLCQEPIDIGRRHDPIWDLQQVCVRWRNTVQGTPSLWSTFNVIGVEVRRTTVGMRIRRCLELSRALPLLMDLQASLSVFPLDAFEDIANHADRWAFLSINGFVFQEAARYTSTLDKSIKQRGLRQLRKLIVTGDDGYDFDLFKRATSLEEVGIIESRPFNASNIPWANVRNFSLHSCSLGTGDTVISVLNAMSESLQELSWRENHYTSVQTRFVSLPSLHTLTVQDMLGLAIIWPMFRAPSLTSIRIINDLGNVPSFISMIQASLGVIKRLYLESCLVECMLPVIKEFRNIEELSLVTVDNTRGLLLSLIWNPESDLLPTKKLLPSLHKLELILPLASTMSVYRSIVSSLTDVMRSRSVKTDKTKGSRRPSVVPLTFVKCIGTVVTDDYEECEIIFSQLKDLGRVLLIEVQVELQKREGTRSSPGLFYPQIFDEGFEP